MPIAMMTTTAAAHALSAALAFAIVATWGIFSNYACSHAFAHAPLHAPAFNHASAWSITSLWILDHIRSELELCYQT